MTTEENPARQPKANAEECFTVVFRGNLRKLQGNPHHYETQFGHVLSVGMGNAFEEASPQEHVTGADLVTKIAQVASGVGFQANVPALDIAGQILSILAANPEHIDRFMVEGTELFLDGTFNYENGSLTYRAMNGSILSPSVLREKKGQQQ